MSELYFFFFVLFHCVRVKKEKEKRLSMIKGQKHDETKFPSRKKKEMFLRAKSVKLCFATLLHFSPVRFQFSVQFFRRLGGLFLAATSTSSAAAALLSPSASASSLWPPLLLTAGTVSSCAWARQPVGDGIEVRCGHLNDHGTAVQWHSVILFHGLRQEQRSGLG